MTEPTKPARKAKSTSPTTHKILVLSSDLPADSRFVAIEAQLDALSAEGWTIHITRVECGLSLLTVYGHATR